MHTLNLEGNNLGDINSSIFSQSLSLNKSIEVLKLSKNNLTDIYIKTCQMFLETNLGLKELHFNYN